MINTILYMIVVYTRPITGCCILLISSLSCPSIYFAFFGRNLLHIMIIIIHITGTTIFINVNFTIPFVSKKALYNCRSIRYTKNIIIEFDTVIYVFENNITTNEINNKK